MKLFAIRKESSDLVIVCAENPEEAVHKAGLDMETVRFVAAQLRDISEETIIRGGIGPQSYEIRELTEISLEFRLDDMGDLELIDIDEESSNIVDEMYPVVDAAATAATAWPGDLLDEERKARFREHMVQAVAKERQRLRHCPDQHSH